MLMPFCRETLAGMRFLVLACVLVALAACRSPMDEVRTMKSFGHTEADRALTAEIQDRLAAERSLDAMDMNVYAYHGHVYLVGVYDREEQKKKAFELVRESVGEKRLTTYLLPEKESECGKREKLDIISSASKKLSFRSAPLFPQMDIDAVLCELVLLGFVDKEADIERARRLAAEVEGVSSVKIFLRKSPVKAVGTRDVGSHPGDSYPR